MILLFKGGFGGPGYGAFGGPGYGSGFNQGRFGSGRGFGGNIFLNLTMNWLEQ